ncbi:MAG: PQQ-dependent sugar dehydrogenase [Verrucomicrobia bacterium]|nr:PQQ-dependent sugar dehydrogenase [Verrucomicrobiota bacterium]
MKFRPLLAGIVTTLPAVVVAAAEPARPVAPRSAAQLHAEICAACHGQRWEGARAPSLLRPVGPAAGRARDPAAVAKVIRDGSLANGMPAFGAILTEAEIGSLVVLIGEAREQARRTGVVPPRSVDGVRLTSELHAFKFERVAGGLVTPWGIAFLPDGRLLVTERPGRLRIVVPGRGIVENITGLPPVYDNNDGGLLDVAVHPDYARTGWIYLSLAENGGREPGASSTVMIRGRIRDGRWVDQETIFRPAPEKYWNNNTHFGSRFLFDRDGWLYFTIGDRGHRPEGQDLGSPYGKLHRVGDDGSIPPDNPFVDRPGAIRSIWSFGHRNQQGLAQHPGTREIWSSEHGPRGGDELNVIGRGLNFGWPVISYGLGEDGSVFTELTRKDGMEQPVVYWTPSIAIGALTFYTGDRFPQWKHQLFGAALAGQRLIRFVIEGHAVTHQELVFTNLGRVRAVVTGPDGLLYVALNSEFGNSPGEIVRLVPDTPAATN